MESPGSISQDDVRWILALRRKVMVGDITGVIASRMAERRFNVAQLEAIAHAFTGGLVAAKNSGKTQVAMPTPRFKRAKATVEELKVEEDATPVEIHRSSEATRIILPKDMKLSTARHWLQRMETDEESFVRVNRSYKAFPMEGARALAQACMERFGWQSLVPTPTFWGPVAPSMVKVSVGVNKTISVPWGRMVFPSFQGDGDRQHLSTGMEWSENNPTFMIGGEIKRKNQLMVDEILDRVQKILSEKSIYQGRAIMVHFPTVDDQDDANPDDFNPEFMDLSSVDPEELVLSKHVQVQVDESLFAPIRYSAACREAGIPLKRGVLMHGDYGTGKTLTARIAAKLCEENDWTFLYLKDVADLSHAIELGRRYSPCVVFAEDIDSAAGGEDRTDEINRILNTIDGVDGKHHEIMVVLTTNHEDAINKAMLRPGRLDATIHIERPDADAVATLIRRYAGKLLAVGEDITEAAKHLEGQTAAIIAEAVKRSKLSAVAARGSVDKITGADLLNSARGMDSQIKLMTNKLVKVIPDGIQAATILAHAIEKSSGVSPLANGAAAASASTLLSPAASAE